jgi:hypothetical protein
MEREILGRAPMVPMSVSPVAAGWLLVDLGDAASDGLFWRYMILRQTGILSIAIRDTGLSLVRRQAGRL